MVWLLPAAQLRELGGAEHRLGEGASGSHRMAMWRETPVCSKRLHVLEGALDLPEDTVRAARASVESYLGVASDLRHPNVGMVLGAVVEPMSGDVTAILTELMPASLQALLEERGLELSLESTVSLASGIAQALAYLHGRADPLPHGNLTAANVLVKGAEAKVSEPGLAEALGSWVQRSEHGQPYAAPEQVVGGVVTCEGDVYSLGALMAHMASGRRPLQYLHGDETNAQRRHEHLRQASDRMPPLDALMRACLDPVPSKRPTAAEAARMLLTIRRRSPEFDPDDLALRGGIVFASEFVADTKAAATLRRRLELVELRSEQDAARREASDKQLLSEARERERVATQLARAQRRIEALQGDLAEQQRVLESTRDDVAAEIASRKAVEGDCDVLRDQLAQALAEAKLLNSNVSEAHKNRSEALDQATKAKRSRDYSVAQLQDKAAVVKRLEEHLAQASKDNDAVTQRAVDAEERVLQTISRWTTAQREQEETLGQLKAATADARRFENEALELKERLRASQERVSALAARGGGIDASALELQVHELSHQLQEAQDLNVSTALRLRESEAEAARLAKALDERERQHQEADEASARAVSEMRQFKERYLEAHTAVAAERRLLQERIDTAMRLRAAVEEEQKNRVKSAAELEEEAWLKDMRVQVEEESRELEPRRIVTDAERQGVPQVVAVLEEHQRVYDVAWRCCRALRDLSFNSLPNQVAVARASGVRLLVNVMKNFVERPEVQRHGLLALANICFNNDSNRGEVGSAGGMALVLRIMVLTGDDPEMQIRACTALTNIIHNSDLNRREMVAERGVDAVLDVMQRFPAHCELQARACWVLLTLAATDDLAAKVAADGGLGAVVAAMLNCPDDATVQQFACWAVANMAAEEEVRQFACREGALEVCEAALACFPDHAEVQRRATEALLRLRTRTEAPRRHRAHRPRARK